MATDGGSGGGGGGDDDDDDDGGGCSWGTRLLDARVALLASRFLSCRKRKWSADKNSASFCKNCATQYILKKWVAVAHCAAQTSALAAQQLPASDTDGHRSIAFAAVASRRHKLRAQRGVDRNDDNDDNDGGDSSNSNSGSSDKTRRARVLNVVSRRRGRPNSCCRGGSGGGSSAAETRTCAQPRRLCRQTGGRTLRLDTPTWRPASVSPPQNPL